MLEISHEAPVNRKESDLQGRCETFICYCSLGPRETASHRALDEFGLGEKRDLGNQPGRGPQNRVFLMESSADRSKGGFDRPIGTP
jgi:hypothetical protein